MTEERIRAFALSLEGAYLDNPFRDGENLVLKHRGNGKWFGIFLQRGETRLLNLKCEPCLAHLLRENVPGVSPGYHMNKTHWNSVEIGLAPDDEIERMILHSYALTKGKGPKGGRKGET